MSFMVSDSTLTIKFGKRVLDDLYVHIDYLHEVRKYEQYKDLIYDGINAIEAEDLKHCNVAKININKNRISFLQYLSFAEDAFPILNVSWVFDHDKKSLTLRSYSASLNPPILHRKELLVVHDHPLRGMWEKITKSAEELGLFSSGNPIGFKLNWQRVIASKGLRFDGNEFLPLGNQVEHYCNENFDINSPIQRHLTALSRSSISAPIQLLISHGLITESVDVFDYGCGRGDDLKALKETGVKCSGWDPHFANENCPLPADIVNLGFVINVIEDPAERVEAIQKSYDLARIALVVSVMLYSKDRPGKPYRDGFVTSRNTFQKYFIQDEFKDYLENILNVEPHMIGPGIAIIFKDKEKEQRFLVSKYRSSNIARRLMGARLSPKTSRVQNLRLSRTPRISKANRLAEELHPTLESLWAQTLDLGRFPEPFEISNLEILLEKLSLSRAKRLISTLFDQNLLNKAAQTRANEIKLFFLSRHFAKKSAFKEFDLRLKTDIKHFYGDYKTANKEALKLLLASANPDEIRNACEEAAAEGLGWLEENSHSLQIHTNLVERLPVVLRAYVACGLILWDSLSDFQLIKIHVLSGKLTLLQYLDFETQAIPLLIKRIKINIPKLDYDFFEYEESTFPPPPLLYKSRYMHEDIDGYAEQVEFDEKLEATGVLYDFDHPPNLRQIQEKLSAQRLEISGLNLIESTSIPQLEQKCGRYLSFKELIHCGETQARLGSPNLPLNPKTYNALYSLSEELLDPVIAYFGSIRLTYGFCSASLVSKINSRIAPKLDQHASHECNKHGIPICDRLGAAVDFIVEDEDMVEVAQWISDNLQFDRMYIYGREKPLHISYSTNTSRLVTFMCASSFGRLMPRSCSPEDISEFASKLIDF